MEVVYDNQPIFVRFFRKLNVSKIHPTAIIDPRAQLASDVEIGPGCILEGAVTLGPGTRLVSYVVLKGPLTLGRNNVIYPFVCIGTEPQDRKFDPGNDGAGTLIGDDNVFRESVTIHRATGAKPTTIGNRNYFMANSHVAHDCLLGSHITLANGSLLAGHVLLQDSVTMSGNCLVHQFCRIGRLAMFSGGRAIAQDVPPFCMVYNNRSVSGLNLVGLRRANLRDHIEPLQRAFEIFYHRGLPNLKAAETIEAQLGDNPLCLEFARFILGGTRRGITPLDPRGSGDVIEDTQ